MDIVNSMRKARRAVAALSLATLIASFFAIGVTQAQTFTDVTTDKWFYTFVEQGVAEGWINGSMGQYRPGDLANRAEMAKLVVEAYDIPLVSPVEPTFVDVEPGTWYYDYVETAAAHAIVGGYKDGNGDLTGYYGPADPVTREQASKMIVLSAPLTINTNCGPTFEDVTNIMWSYDYVETLYVNSVVDGYPNTNPPMFMPGANINRAEISKMVANGLNPLQRACGGFSLDVDGVNALSATSVEVCFSGAYDEDSALMADNYSIVDDNDEELAVTDVEASSKSMCVVLTTDPQDSTKVYTVTVSDVTSETGEELLGATASFDGYSIADAGALTVTLDGSTPDEDNIPKNGANILYSVFAFTASDDEGISVDQLVVSRAGLGFPGDFKNIKIYVDGVQKGGEKTVSSSTNSATFNLSSDPIMVPAGKTVLVEVRADMDAQENSENQLCVATSDDVLAYGDSSEVEVLVGGDFAVCGNTMTTTSATVGTLTYKVSNVSTSDINIGDTDVVMTKVRMDMAGEDVDVNRITFKQVGSADSEDFGNPRLYVSGTALDVTASWEGDFLTFDLADAPIFIEKGNSKTVELWIDSVGGLNSTAAFDIYRDWHIEGEGRVYHYGVNVTEDVGSVVPTSRNIVGGNVAFSLSANNPILGDVARGANDHEFLRFNINTAGDSVTVRKISLTVSTTGGSNANIDDLKIWGKNTKDEWVVVAGPNEVTTALPDTYRFTDTFEVPAASTTEFIVTADISNSATLGEIYRIDVADVNVANNMEIEYGDGTPVNVATEVTGGVLTGNDQTVAVPTVAVSLAATPGDKSYVKNNLNKDLVAFDFQASTASDIKVTGITVTCTTAASLCSNAFQSLTLYEVDGSTITKVDGPRTMSTTTAPSGAVTFSTNYTIPKGQTARLLVRGNVGSAAGAGTYAFTIGAGNVTAEDSESNTVTPTGLATAARTITIAGSGTFSSQGVSGTEVTGRILNGTSLDNDVLKVRYAASEEEAWVVKKMRVQAVNATNTAIVPIYNGAEDDTLAAWAVTGAGFKTDLATLNGLITTDVVANQGAEAVVIRDAAGIDVADAISYDNGAAPTAATYATTYSYYVNDDLANDTFTLNFCTATDAALTAGLVCDTAFVATEGQWVTRNVNLVNPARYYGLVVTAVGGGGSVDANDAVILDNVQFAVTSTAQDSAVSKVWVTYLDNNGDEQTASTTLSGGVADFTSLNAYVPANSDQTVLVSLDMAPVGSGGATTGTPLKLIASTVNFEAVGASSGSVKHGMAMASSEYFRAAKSQPVIAKGTPSTTLGNSEVTLYEVSVTADDMGKIALKQLAFDVSASNAGGAAVTLSNFKVVTNDTTDISTAKAGVDISNDAGLVDCETAACIDTAVTASDKILVQFDDGANAAEYTVNAGQTVKFALKATASGADTTGDQVNTTLSTDTAGYYGVITLDGVGADAQMLNLGGAAAPSNFVWTDFSASSHNSVLGSSTADWLDGALVKGLSAAGSHILTK